MQNVRALFLLFDPFLSRFHSFLFPLLSFLLQFHPHWVPPADPVPFAARSFHPDSGPLAALPVLPVEPGPAAAERRCPPAALLHNSGTLPWRGSEREFRPSCSYNERRPGCQSRYKSPLEQRMQRKPASPPAAVFHDSLHGSRVRQVPLIIKKDRRDSMKKGTEIVSVPFCSCAFFHQYGPLVTWCRSRIIPLTSASPFFKALP